MQSYADPDCRNSWAKHISSPRSREAIVTVLSDIPLFRRWANVSKLNGAVSPDFMLAMFSQVVRSPCRDVAQVIKLDFPYITPDLHSYSYSTLLLLAS